MSTIQTTATFPNIPAERLSEFKDLAAQMMAITRTEADTLQYDWFFNDDETTCVVRETYASSEAVLAHVASCSSESSKPAGTWRSRASVPRPRNFWR